MPIPLGVLAAAGAGGGGAVATFDLIQTITVTNSTTTSVTFSNLNNFSQYQHLQIRWTCKFDSTSTARDLIVQMNGSGSNYSRHYIQVQNNVRDSGNTINTGYLRLGEPPGTASTSSFAAGVADLLDFSSTSKFKTTRALWGSAGNVDTYFRAGLESGVWRDLSAVTSILLRADNSNNLLTGSRFSLYGIR